MNAALLTLILSQIIAPLLAGFVTLARLKLPTATNAEIATEVEGDVRHSLRSKLGFLVDVLWSVESFTSGLDTAVNEAVSENQLPSEITNLLNPAAKPSSVPAAQPKTTEGTLNTSEPLELNSAGTFTQA